MHCLPNIESAICREAPFNGTQRKKKNIVKMNSISIMSSSRYGVVLKYVTIIFKITTILYESSKRSYWHWHWHFKREKKRKVQFKFQTIHGESNGQPASERSYFGVQWRVHWQNLFVGGAQVAEARRHTSWHRMRPGTWKCSHWNGWKQWLLH